MSHSAPAYAHALPSTATQCEAAVSGPGQALAPELRSEFETAFDADLSAVRLHTGTAPAAATARANARAFALGDDIGFAAGEFRPETPQGRALIGHELVHVIQARRGGSGPRARAETEAGALGPRAAEGGAVQVHGNAPAGPVFALRDYLESSPDISSMMLSDVQQDIDEITEFLDRQFESSQETLLLEEAREELRMRKAELLRGITETAPAKQKRKKKRKKVATEETPLPEDAPRILRERSSVGLSDPDEVRTELDRIVAWLQRPDVTREDREILQDELRTLAPQREEARQQESAQRQSQRVQAAFQRRSSGGGEKADLRHQLGIVESIYTDPAEPDVRFILHEGERVRISVEQAETLKKRTNSALRGAIRKARDQANSAMSNYRFQKNLNDDQFIVSSIAGWLGGVDDPWMAVIKAKTRADAGIHNAEVYLDTGNLVRAVDPIVQAAEAAARLDKAVDAWRDGLMEGASLAVGVLTFVRDASAAIVTAIAAVVAAPVVAGYAAGVGLGATGTALATTAGTGLVVGTGAGATYGGAEYAGQRLAGASHEEAADAAGTEAKRRFAEGAAAGVGGGATRIAGQALRVGGNTGFQVARRGGAEMIGNFLGTTTGGVLQGEDLDDAAGQGFRSAGIGLLGNVAGSFGRSPVAQEAIEFGTNAVVSTTDTLAQGGSWRDAGLNLTVMTASQGALTRMPGAQSDIARYESNARAAGTRHRRAAQNTIGAVGLGVQMSMPPDGFGGTHLPDLPEIANVQRAHPTEPALPARPDAGDQAPASRAQQRGQKTADAGLELDRRPWQERNGGEIQDPSTRALAEAADADTPLELDTRSSQSRDGGEVQDPSLRDLGDTSGPDLKLDRRSNIPSHQWRRNSEHGVDTGIVSGSEHRSGEHFHEYNAAEIGQARLRIRRDGRGRTEVVRFTLTAEAVASKQSTKRAFTADRSTEGPQAVKTDYTNTGYDRGHLAPREAASLASRFVEPEFQQSHADIQAQTERAMDHMTNVVPMAREFNQHGAWRQAELQANQWATRHGRIDVEIRPYYGDNPRRLPSGMDVPDGFVRIERRPDGRILRRKYYRNE